MKAMFLGLALAAFTLTGLSTPAHAGSMAHLKFSNGAIHAHCLWLQGPQTMNESILQINWMNGADHSPMELPGTFTVKLVMPSMPEMQNPPTQIAPLLDKDGTALVGAYQVSSIYFTMGGDWEVQVTVTYADGSQETQAIALDL
jgi:hypothetical protein